ncbi:hydroxypyruvate isomerase [Bradyrhizobium sp. LM2.3]
MPRFAANLSMMFTEVPFLDRFDVAAQAGFTAVEFLFPYEHPAEAVGERLKRNGLTQALFNLPPGDWNAGEKGFAALPSRFAELKQSLETALPYAKATGVKRLHLMAGIANRGERVAIEAFLQIGGVGRRVLCAARHRHRARADQCAQCARLFPQ